VFAPVQFSWHISTNQPSCAEYITLRSPFQ
jgi:hypothetical protein